MLEKKEKLLGKKAAAEVEKAKQFTQAKNRSCKAPLCWLFRFLWVTDHKHMFWETGILAYLDFENDFIDFLEMRCNGIFIACLSLNFTIWVRLRIMVLIYDSLKYKCRLKKHTSVPVSLCYGHILIVLFVATIQRQ